MPPHDIVIQIARLKAMKVTELRSKYAEVFGEPTFSRNKDYLWKRIAYRIQELAEGGLPDRAKQRAEELARDTDLRVRPPKDARLPDVAAQPKKRDERLPPAGTVLTRSFGEREHAVTIVDDGFEYDGRTYHSLSAVARAITGTRWNGFVFFRDALDAHVR